MTSEGLGEMFEGNSADRCARKIPLVQRGAERRVPRAGTRERGPPSALAEFVPLPKIGEESLNFSSFQTQIEKVEHLSNNL